MRATSLPIGLHSLHQVHGQVVVKAGYQLKLCRVGLPRWWLSRRDDVVALLWPGRADWPGRSTKEVSGEMQEHCPRRWTADWVFQGAIWTGLHGWADHRRQLRLPHRA